jgi:hypothetical protein
VYDYDIQLIYWYYNVKTIQILKTYLEELIIPAKTKKYYKLWIKLKLASLWLPPGLTQLKKG